MSCHALAGAVLQQSSSRPPASERRRVDQFADAARITDAAEQLLAEGGHSQLRNVRCDCKDGTLMLWGSVTDARHKQLARELVQKLPGVTFVVDVVTIEPQPDAEPRSPESSATKPLPAT